MIATATLAAILVFLFGGYLVWAYWATLVGQAGSWYSRIRSWLVGVTGGTASTMVAVYTRYCDGVLTPALNTLEGLFFLDFGTLYGWACVFVIAGTQVMPIIVITYNVIMYGQPVVENMPHGEKKRRYKKARQLRTKYRYHRG